MKKQWKAIKVDFGIVKKLQSELKINPILIKLLIQRGIKTFDQAKLFFRPELSNLHDPFLMKDMDAALERLEKAIENKEKILIYGDYDVDGTTAVALFYSFLKDHHKNLDYYIPDRYKEGYGVSMAGIDFAKQNRVDLIITLDCGIKAHEKVERAKFFGIDFIICDHHTPDKTLPKAVAVLNPKREDCPYPYKELSGCGIGFKFAQAFYEKNKLAKEYLWDLLDYVVLSIASDIVPITGENRILAHFGLKKLNKTERVGFKALIEKSRRPKPLKISDIVFGLGPMINAAGRISDARQAIRLMLSTTKPVAQEYAKILDYRNQLRKEIDKIIVEEATDDFKNLPDNEKRKTIVLYNEKWHKGVVGIAASRLVEIFHRPVIILTESNGKMVGSARTIKGFNLLKAITKCSELLENFGGHSYAAGLTLLPENFDAFVEKFEAIGQKEISPEILKASIIVSSVIDFEKITPKFMKLLKQFAPFGPGNRNPVFVTKNVKDTGYSKPLKGEHLKLSVKQKKSKPMNGIAFGQSSVFKEVYEQKTFDVCYTLEESIWNGKTYIQLMVKDIRIQ